MSLIKKPSAHLQKGGRAFFMFFFLFLFSVSSSYALGPGKLKLNFVRPSGQVYRDLAVVFEKSGQFQNIVDGLNREFIFPQDIKVEFSRKDGPLYNPRTKTIIMSYDFIFYLTTIYVEKYPNASDDEMLNFSLEASTFLFYHELAHALIDVYHLPIVSNEETAADNLAVIIALEYTNDGYNVAMNSAEFFDLLDQTKKVYREDELWDEHALDSQRFFNIVCLTYGRYPSRVKDELSSLKNKALLKFIREKGSFCKEEYKSQLQGWLRLLDPYMISDKK